MSEFQEHKIQDLIRLQIIEKPLDGNHGSIHPTSKDYVEKGIPFVMATDINNGNLDLKHCKYIDKETSKKLRKGFSIEGDVLLTHKASIGRTAIVPKLNSEYIVLTPQVTYYRVKDKNQLNNKYLRYYFDSKTFQDNLRSFSGSGSTRAYIGITEQQNLTIKLPPLPTQKAIAEILSSLDDKIELNNQINQNLEALAQALFKQWFVDFEFPNENGEPYKSSGGEMIGSELGEIPKGWRVSKLGLIGKVITGKTPSSKNPHHFGESTPFVTPSDFKSYFKVITSSERGLSAEGAQAFYKNLLPKNSVIVTCIGSDMGKIAVNKEDCVTNQQINSIVFSSESGTSSEYTYYYLKNIYLELRNMATGGSTMPIINKSQFENIDILAPISDLISIFTSIIRSIDEQIELNVRETIELIKLRDTLLPKLISGELEVNQFEQETHG